MAKPEKEKIMLLQLLDALNRGVLNESVAVHKILSPLAENIQATAWNEAP